MRNKYQKCENCDGDGIIPRQEHFGTDKFCEVCNGSGDVANPAKPTVYVAGFTDTSLPEYD